MLRAVLSTEKACYSGSFHSNIRVQSKHDCYGSEPARLWKADAKGIRVSRRTRKHKGDSFVLGVCLTDLFLLGNFHQLSASSTKEFFVMQLHRYSDLPEFAHLFIDEKHPQAHIEKVPTGFYSDGVCQRYRNWFITSDLTRISFEPTIVVPVWGAGEMSDADIVATFRAAIKMSDRIGFEAWLLRSGHYFSLQRLKSFSLAEFRGTNTDTYDLFQKHKGNSQIVSDYWEKVKPIWEGQNPEAGYVYILSDSLGHYKIGRTKHLTNRIKQLSTQPPFAITLVAAFRAIDASFMELSMHAEFMEHRLNGEWFNLTKEQVEGAISSFAVGEYITEDFLAENNKVKLLTTGKVDYNY